MTSGRQRLFGLVVGLFLAIVPLASQQPGNARASAQQVDCSVLVETLRVRALRLAELLQEDADTFAAIRSVRTLDDADRWLGALIADPETLSEVRDDAFRSRIQVRACLDQARQQPSPAAPSPAAPAPSATAAPGTSPATAPNPSTAAAPGPAGPVGAAAAGSAGVTVPAVVPIAPVPTIPVTRDVSPVRDPVKRETCMNFSSDPALWQAVADQMNEYTGFGVPTAMVEGCVAMYRAQPWPQAPGGATLGDGTNRTGDKARDATPVKGTLETQTGQILRAGDKGQNGPTDRNAPLAKGDAVVTRTDPAVLRFDDGSRFEIGRESALLAADPAEKSFVQLRGRMFMDIKSRGWVIRIPNTRGVVSVAIRGTVLTTEVLESGAVRVEVTEGTVDVSSGGETAAVKAGSSIVVEPGVAPPEMASGSSTVLALGGAAALIATLAIGGFLWTRRRPRSNTAA